MWLHASFYNHNVFPGTCSVFGTGRNFFGLSCSDGTVTAVHHSVTGFRSKYGFDVTNAHICMHVHFCVCDVNDAGLCHRRLATSTRDFN